MTYLPAVAGVAVVGKYRLRLLFDDGTVGDVDFSAQEWPGVFEPLRDPSYFAQVRVDPEAGTIVWPNGLDMAPEPLYEEARRHPLAAMLSIEDDETELLAKEVVALTGESKTGAIRNALRERREVVALQRSAADRGTALRSLLEEEIWPALPTAMIGRGPTAAEQDAILGYGMGGRKPSRPD